MSTPTGKFRSRLCTIVVKSISDFQMQGNALGKGWLEEGAGVPEARADAVSSVPGHFELYA